MSGRKFMGNGRNKGWACKKRYLIKKTKPHEIYLDIEQTKSEKRN